MTDNVTYLETTLDVPVERVLQSAEALSCDRVIVLGWRGDVMYFATSTSDVLDINLTLDIAKRRVLDGLMDE